jgi:hypothetical protein
MNVVWEPPVYEVHEFFSKRTSYCVIIVVLNEGQRIKGQLERMKERAHLADIVIADGRSTDGSTDLDLLRAAGVRALLVALRHERVVARETRSEFHDDARGVPACHRSNPRSVGSTNFQRASRATQRGMTARENQDS